MTSSVTLRWPFPAPLAPSMCRILIASIFSIGRTLSRTMPSMRSKSLPAKARQASGVAEGVLRLVELHRAFGLDFVARRRRSALIFSASAPLQGGDLRAASARLAAAFFSASAFRVTRTASRSASRVAAMSSVVFRRSAISRSRAVIDCSSASIALIRAASAAAIAADRSPKLWRPRSRVGFRPARPTGRARTSSGAHRGLGETRASASPRRSRYARARFPRSEVISASSKA